MYDLKTKTHDYDVYVENSVSGKRWIVPKIDTVQAKVLKNKTNLPYEICEILTQRGITSENVEGYLNPRMKDLMPDPFDMKDMQKAVERLIKAITENQRIAFFCDYDTDGGTSGGLASTYFNAIKANLVKVYVPHRAREGYGPKVENFKIILDDYKPDVLITMDCGSGIEAHTAIQFLNENKVDVIVLDHHTPQQTTPAFAEVNPRHPDDKTGLDYLAACGVVFMTLIALHRELKKINFFKDKNIAEPDLMALIDVLTFGTIGDVVPLVGLNRAFVVNGLKRMNNPDERHPAISFLLETAGYDKEITASTIGYTLVPRTNANNRLGDKSDMIVKLFSAKTKSEMNDIAARFHEYNQLRQDIQAKALKGIYRDNLHINDDYCLIIKDKEWPLGIIGVLAGQIKDDVNKVVCALTFNERTGHWEGSGRSVEGVDLGAIILKAIEQGLLVNGGGHPMAAGFALHEEKIDDFRALMNAEIKEMLNGKPIVKQVEVSAIVSATAVNLALADAFSIFEPCGQSNEKPVLIITGAKLMDVRTAGAHNDTVLCQIRDSAGGGYLKAVAFRQSENSPLKHLLLTAGQSTVNLLGYLDINEFRGTRTPQFKIIDAVKDSVDF